MEDIPENELAVPDGATRWLISCDESGTNGAKYYGFGSLWMKWERRGDFARDFRELANRHHFLGECKWNKANSQRRYAFFSDLIEYFFKKPWLAFHCIVIRKGIVKLSYHSGSYDLARRKHFTRFLTAKVNHSMKAHPKRKHIYRVWVDPIASSYGKAHEAVEVVSNNMLAQLRSIKPIESVQVKSSHETPSIQICDFLLGAVMDAWQKEAQSDYKAQLQTQIASHLGWDDLYADTFPKERKFNIWYFADLASGAREAQTRVVNLKYPLPEHYKVPASISIDVQDLEMSV